MRIGIVCYASVGGSGIIATELGKTLAARSHDVHILSSDMPFRLGEYQPGLTFHRVDTPSYPLFREPQYLLSLANKIVQVARSERLDIVHAHYAIPHATAGYLARQILVATRGGPVPSIITTLHGTDITLLGSDRSYTETVAFCIEQSDGVTAVSESLKRDTYRELGITKDIRVIPNFLDCSTHRRVDAEWVRQRVIGDPAGKVLVHVSNFRPVKRVAAVVDVFARVDRLVPAHLLMVGDGPDRDLAARYAAELGVADRVHFLGEQDEVRSLLSIADVFLLPSAQESFGLAALEAMACEVPVVASNVGGLPEVIEHGVNGFLHPPAEHGAMARSAAELLADRALHRRVAAAALETVQVRFCDGKIVPLYEDYYEEVLKASKRAAV
ncbi:MAG: N-acetyl-alpha-D-glucosaminyl L-malate synthase BshA [Acidobacteria bacterium]|nr:N-acetyl-alpha-D-glucosaminyl L-malate synthase BshA [Acidobacteriota bacterium]